VSAVSDIYTNQLAFQLVLMDSTLPLIELVSCAPRHAIHAQDHHQVVPHAFLDTLSTHQPEHAHKQVPVLMVQYLFRVLARKLAQMVTSLMEVVYTIVQTDINPTATMAVFNPSLQHIAKFLISKAEILAFTTALLDSGQM